MKLCFLIIILAICTTCDAYGFLNKDKDKGKAAGRHKNVPKLKKTVVAAKPEVSKKPAIAKAEIKTTPSPKPPTVAERVLPPNVKKETVDKLQQIEQQHYHGNRELLIKHLQRQIEMKKIQELIQQQKQQVHSDIPTSKSHNQQKSGEQNQKQHQVNSIEKKPESKYMHQTHDTIKADVNIEKLNTNSVHQGEAGHQIHENTAIQANDKTKRNVQQQQQIQTQKELNHHAEPQQQAQKSLANIQEPQSQLLQSQHHQQNIVSQQSNLDLQQQHNNQQQVHSRPNRQLPPQQSNLVMQQPHNQHNVQLQNQQNMHLVQQQQQQPNMMSQQQYNQQQLQQQQQLQNQQNIQLAQQSKMISQQHVNQRQQNNQQRFIQKQNPSQLIQHPHQMIQQQNPSQQLIQQPLSQIRQEINHIEQSFVPQQDLLQIQNQFKNRHNAQPQMQMQPMDMHQPVHYLQNDNPVYQGVQAHAQIKVQQPQIRIQHVQQQPQQNGNQALQHVFLPLNTISMDSLLNNKGGSPERYVIMSNSGNNQNNVPAPATPTPPLPTTTTPKPTTSKPKQTTTAADSPYGQQEYTVKRDTGSIKERFFEKEMRKQDLEIMKLELEIRALKRDERNGQLIKEIELEAKKQAAQKAKTTTTLLPPMFDFGNKKMKFPFDF